MAVWSKLKEELDRAGRAAQDAIDEGKVRLDIMRARQLADKAAQALGYALYRARQQGEDLNPDTYARLSSTLAAHEAEIIRIERRLDEIRTSRKGARADTAPPAADTATPEPPPAAAAGAEPPPAPGV